MQVCSKPVAEINNEEALVSQQDNVAPLCSWLVSLQPPGDEVSVVWKARADLGSREDTVLH